MKIDPSFGKYGVYASDYCKLDSDVRTGGGTDETGLLQEILDTAVKWGHLHLIMDGAALIRGLTIHSNTTIECLDADCGFYLMDGADDALFKNEISEYTVTARNITFKGGTYNHNNLHQSMEPPKEKCLPEGRSCSDITVAFRFFGVENFRMEDVTIVDQKRYALLMGNWENVFLTNIHMPLPHDVPRTNQDGLHFHGPGKHLRIVNCYGRGGDDFIALNTDEGDKESSISDVLIDGVYLEDAYQGVRLLSRNNGVLEDVCIRNVYGTYRSFGFYITPWFDDGAGHFRNITIEHVCLKQKDHIYKQHIPFLFNIGGRIENLTLRDITSECEDPQFRFLQVLAGAWDPDAKVSVKGLFCDGLNIRSSAAAGEEARGKFFYIDCLVDYLRLTDVYAVSTASAEALIEIGSRGSIGKLDTGIIHTQGISRLSAPCGKERKLTEW